MHHQESEAKTNENTDGARGLRPEMFAEHMKKIIFLYFCFDPTGQKSREKYKD